MKEGGMGANEIFFLLWILPKKEKEKKSLKVRSFPRFEVLFALVF